ncbi:Peptidase M15 [compost metagenome]
MLVATTDGVSSNSLHMRGKAIDVRLAGVPLARLRDLALARAAGGVGYYPDSNFVHLDVGRPRSWSG